MNLFRNKSILFITNVPLKGNSTSINLMKYIDKEYQNLTILKEYSDNDELQFKNTNVVYYSKMKRLNFLKYLINPIKGYIKLKQLKKIYDICIIDAPNVGIIGVIGKYFGICKCLVYQDVDYQPGFFKKGFKRLIITISEKIAIRCSDIIFSVSDSLRNLRVSQTKKRVIQIRNGIDHRKFKEFSRIRSLNDKNISLIFIGRLDSNNINILLLIDSVNILKERFPNIILKLVGEGNNLEDLKNYIYMKGLSSNIILFGKVSHSNIPTILNDSSIGVAPYISNDNVKYSFSLKIIEYMAIGLPVVATGIGEVENIINESNGGIFVSQSPEDLANVIISLLTDKEKYSSCSKNAIKYTKDLDWGILFKKEFYEISNVCNAKN